MSIDYKEMLNKINQLSNDVEIIEIPKKFEDTIIDIDEFEHNDKWFDINDYIEETDKKIKDFKYNELDDDWEIIYSEG